MTTKVLVGYNDKGNNPDIAVFEGHLGNGPSRPVHASSFVSAGRRTGSGRIALLDNIELRNVQPASKTTVSLDLTYFKAAGWLGSHEIQTGVYLQPRLRNTSTTYYSNDGFSLEEVALRDPNNAAAGTIPFHRRYYDVASITTVDLHASDNAVYVQDSWKPGARLTINAGVRLDWINASDPLFDFDMVSDLAIGPRVGANYALTADSKNILRASYGRVGDVPNSTYIGSAGSAVAGIRDEYDHDLDGTFESVFLDAGRHARVAEPPDRSGSAMALGGRDARRISPPAAAAADARCQRHLARVQTPSGAGRSQRHLRRRRLSRLSDVTQNDILLITDNHWNSFVYRGVEIDVTKRTSRMQLIANYTRAWQHIDGTWQPNDPASFIQPDAFANDKGLGTIRGNTPNSLRDGRRAEPDVGRSSGAARRRLRRALESRAGGELVGAVGTLPDPSSRASRRRIRSSVRRRSPCRTDASSRIRWRRRFASPAPIAVTSRSKRRISTSSTCASGAISASASASSTFPSTCSTS